MQHFPLDFKLVFVLHLIILHEEYFILKKYSYKRIKHVNEYIYIKHVNKYMYTRIYITKKY